MVSLNTAFGLCSLIDQQGFLHVSEDENDCALVTLGRNIVIRYRLADQKQLNSWSTIPQLTSKVIYDASKAEFLGIFNENTIKKWNQDDTNLDKVSRIKLKSPAHSILLDEEPVALFTSGACCKLVCLEDRNHEPLKGFLPNESKILSAKIVNSNDRKQLVVIALIGEKHTICYSVPLSQETLKPILASLKSLKLRRRGHELLGCCFVGRESVDHLVTLWSDGFLYALALPLALESTEMALGRFMGVLRAVSLSSPVALTSLSERHLAVYGGDPAEEGAVLAVYNLEFGMVQAATSFKLLQKPPRVWAVHGRLLVGLGQRLVCVPYSLQTGSVAALVGSRSPELDAKGKDVMAVMPCVTWEEGQLPIKDKMDAVSIHSDLHADIDALAAQGCSEAGICEAIISQLMEKQDVLKLSWCLDHFVDIPERLVVRLLSFSFTAPENRFLKLTKTTSPQKNDISIDEVPMVNGGCTPKSAKKRRKDRKSNVPETNGICVDFVNEESSVKNPISPPERAEFLDRILRVPGNRATLVPALRTGLSIADCIFLLRYLTYLLSAGKAELEQATIDWATTVVDAFYQQLVLGRHSQCVESVLSLKEKVEEKIATLNELKDLLPIVLRLKDKGVPKNPTQSKSYSIQKFQLYQ